MKAIGKTRNTSLRVERKTLRQILKMEYPLILMVLPALILVAIYSYGPMIGVVIAFQKFIPTKGFFGSKWVGMQNFRTLFAMPTFKQVIFNTVFIALAKMIGNVIIPVLFALLLNEFKSTRVRRTFQTCVYLPHFLSWIILAGIFKDILALDGAINLINQKLGLTPIGFLSNQYAFRWTMIVTDLWKEFGFGSIIYLAALTAIDPNLYEAAMIDGANRFRQTIHVTLPGILPTIVLMTVLSMANILNGGFDQIYNMYSPAVYGTGDILDTFVYRLGIDNAQFALATAAGLLKSGVSFVFIVSSYWMADRYAGYRIF